MTFAAARRLLAILGAVAGPTALIAVVIALATGGALDRAVSVGFYSVGSFCTILGFALTTHGALRPGLKDVVDYKDAGTASGVSGLLIAVGLIIVVAGLVIDPHEIGRASCRERV